MAGSKPEKSLVAYLLINDYSGYNDDPEFLGIYEDKTDAEAEIDRLTDFDEFESCACPAADNPEGLYYACRECKHILCRQCHDGVSDRCHDGEGECRCDMTDRCVGVGKFRRDKFERDRLEIRKLPFHPTRGRATKATRMA